jgi:phosphoketolase
MVIVPTGKTLEKLNRYRRTTTMTSKGKKTMRKKKVATRLKVKKMKTALLGATPRRTRHSTTLTRSKLLEMKPRSPLAD